MSFTDFFTVKSRNISCPQISNSREEFTFNSGIPIFILIIESQTLLSIHAGNIK